MKTRKPLILAALRVSEWLDFMRIDDTIVLVN